VHVAKRRSFSTPGGKAKERKEQFAGPPRALIPSQITRKTRTSLGDYTSHTIYYIERGGLFPVVVYEEGALSPKVVFSAPFSSGRCEENFDAVAEEPSFAQKGLFPFFAEEKRQNRG